MIIYGPTDEHEYIQIKTKASNIFILPEKDNLFL